MGRCIKVVTKSRHSTYVHELSIAAAELEERYRTQQVLDPYHCSNSMPLANLLCTASCSTYLIYWVGYSIKGLRNHVSAVLIRMSMRRTLSTGSQGIHRPCQPWKPDSSLLCSPGWPRRPSSSSSSSSMRMAAVPGTASRACSLGRSSQRFCARYLVMKLGSRFAGGWIPSTCMENILRRKWISGAFAQSFAAAITGTDSSAGI